MMPEYWGSMFTRIHCKDGASVSVQASRTHYSTPRETFLDKDVHYTAVELGFFENCEHPAYLKEYSDTGSVPSDIYGYVPVELVERWITEHGGIDLGKTIATHHRTRNPNK